MQREGETGCIVVNWNVSNKLSGWETHLFVHILILQPVPFLCSYFYFYLILFYSTVHVRCNGKPNKYNVLIMIILLAAQSDECYILLLAPLTFPSSDINILNPLWRKS
jgi:hypothetical protein